jgi:phosphohistidine phosphatase
LADPKAILKVIRECGGTIPHLMIVGHNPGIAECADKLSAEREIDSMPTCAVVTALFDINTWQELDWKSGTEVEFDYPRNSG